MKGDITIDYSCTECNFVIGNSINGPDDIPLGIAVAHEDDTNHHIAMVEREVWRPHYLLAANQSRDTGEKLWQQGHTG